MGTEKKELGRPRIKPKRSQTGFALNDNLFDKIGLLKIKWGEDSLNDTYNRMIIETLKREKI
jgi:hypothetical protein